MRDRFLALWRTGAQAGFALLLTVLVNHGIHIPDAYSGYVQVALIGAGAGVWAVGTHWLQSRTGNQWYNRLARFAGRVLVLGAGALPTYTPPAGPTSPGA
jgi:hypothetical protein